MLSVAALLALASLASGQALTPEFGTVARFSCSTSTTTNGVETVTVDSGACANLATTYANGASPCAADTTSLGGTYGNVDEFGFKNEGYVPVNSECLKDPASSAYYCGYVGAATTVGTCQGGLGYACTLDSQCLGNLACTNPTGSVNVQGVCGGFSPLGDDSGDGATCTDGLCYGGSFACASGSYCSGVDSTCHANPLTPSAASRHRRDISPRGSRCPASHTACPLTSGVAGFECVDTTTNLEQCGACASQGGVDCTALPGVDAVGCVEGKCEIWACQNTHVWDAATASCIESTESVWEKPSELKTPVELEMEKTPWKEYETGGRKYWVHKDTKETTWEMPIIIREILNRAAAPPPPPPQPFQSPQPAQTPTFVPPSSGLPLTPMSGALVAPGGFVPNANPNLPSRPSLTPAPVTNVIPEFATFEEAERAFMEMLGRSGVTVDWTWEKTMREVITDPLYKVLKSLAEKKAAFEKFVKEKREEARVAREKSLERCRKEFHRALERMGGGTDKEDGVKAWWSKEKGMYEAERRLPAEIWGGPANDEERRTLIEEFIAGLRGKETAKKRELRNKNVDKVTKILQSLSLDLAGTVRWRDAREAIFQSEEWQRDPELQKIEPVDLLTVYEDELKKAEKEASETRQKTAEEKRRRARKAREQFQKLLHELCAVGHISAGSKWKDAYYLIDPDERYHNLLGIPGSSPLDLFWDVVDELDLKLEDDQKVVEAVLDTKRVIVTEEMTLAEFEKSVEGDERLKALDEGVVPSVFEKLHARAVRHAKEERRRAEKKLRIQIDDLRYAYKKLDPPVDLESSYEDNLERIQETPEFKVLEDETARRTAFEKFIKRQKEKLKEREREHSEEPSSERRGDSHRDRSSRSHRDSRHHDSRRDSMDVDQEGEAKSKREASEELDADKRRAKREKREEDVKMEGVKKDDEDAEEGEI
ncbi:formin binding protein [Pseudohyphozyma bogoriensis]|nr:formin binding protein [Pseudohyphozyma bogoriensis]